MRLTGKGSVGIAEIVSEVLSSPFPSMALGKGACLTGLEGLWSSEQRCGRNAALGTSSLTCWNVSPFIRLAVSGLLTGWPLLFWRRMALLVWLEPYRPEEEKIHETKIV